MKLGALLFLVFTLSSCAGQAGFELGTPTQAKIDRAIQERLGGLPSKIQSIENVVNAQGAYLSCLKDPTKKGCDEVLTPKEKSDENKND